MKKDIQIDFLSELKNYHEKYIFTCDFTKYLAKKYKMAQYKVRDQFSDFMPFAHPNNISTYRTSEIFMTGREKHTCPKYRYSWVSHVFVI